MASRGQSLAAATDPGASPCRSSNGPDHDPGPPDEPLAHLGNVMPDILAHPDTQPGSVVLSHK